MLTDYSFMAVMDILLFRDFADSFIRKRKNRGGLTMGVFLVVISLPNKNRKWLYYEQ